MKTKPTKLLYLAGMIALLIALQFACKKDDPKPEETLIPSCSLTFPYNNEHYDLGENITISINAIDFIGVSKVVVYINDEERATLKNFPYNYTWNTSNEFAKKYTIKAIAYNHHGNSRNSEVITVKLDSVGYFTDERDGKEYKKIYIGNQWWMAENLQYEVPNSYSMDSIYEKTYGRQYNAVDVCPAGWHLPSDQEWDELVNYLGGENIAGGKLKEKGTEHWEAPNTDATDQYGFSALPAGYTWVFGDFDSLGYKAVFWSSTQVDSLENSNWCREIDHNSGEIKRDTWYTGSWLSLRCVKD